jgi:hypothetical protein
LRLDRRAWLLGAALAASLALRAVPSWAGRAHILAGQDARSLTVIEGLPGDELGSAFGNDAVPGGTGLLVGAPGAAGGTGRVDVYAAAGDVLFEVIDGATLAAPVERFGHSILDLGHLEGAASVWWAIGAPARLDSATTPVVVVLREQNRELRELYRVEGEPGSLFGWALGFVDDLDGDGEPEFMVGAPGASPGGRAAAGALFAYSGRTGAPLWTLEGIRAGEHLGLSIAGCPTLGLPGEEFLIGAPGNGRRRRGSVYLVGSSGEISRVLAAPPGAAHFGYSAICLPFADRGTGLFVGAPSSGFRKPGAGAVYVLDADASVIARLDGQRRSQHLGVTVDGWGRRDTQPIDLALGSALERGRRSGRGQLDIHAQPAWGRIFRLRGSNRNDRLGGAVSSTFDLDGDGFFELLVGEPQRKELWLPGPPRRR